MRQNLTPFFVLKKRLATHWGCVKMKETPCHVVPSSRERLRVGERSSGMEGWGVAIKHGSTDITII